MATSEDQESPTPKTMKRQEWWRQNYLQKRYLEHATNEELNQRLRDLLENVCDFNAEGQFVMKKPAEDCQWIEYFTHLREEHSLRGRGIDPRVREDVRFLENKNARRAAALWQGRNIALGTYLLKYSKLQYLRPLLNLGNLRVAPASHYKDPSLNPSIRDTELEFTEEYHGAQVRHPPNGDHSVPQDQWIEMPIVGNAKSTWHSPGDFYITCFSSSYEYRLYDDFEAEGCLVIKDIVRFAKSLKNRMEESLPGWVFAFGAVDYRDPYHPKQNLNLMFSKHFRYAYQQEFRFAWRPPTKWPESLKPIYLELGPLTDYCELLVL